MNHPLIEYISTFIPLEEEEIGAISSQIEIKQYPAGEVLLRAGSISKQSFFNIKGCVRMYHLIDGEEKTTFFYTENRFISSFRSFHGKTPATHYLACLEDCTLALIPFELEQALLKKYPKLETFARIVLEQELANYQEMLSAHIIANPEQRYQNLIENHAELLQRVPLYHLASYLGIKKESLSRIRKRIGQKGF